MRCIKCPEVIQLFHLKLVNGIKEVLLICVNDATRYAQLLQERRKTAMTHTQSFVGEGFGEKYSEW